MAKTINHKSEKTHEYKIKPNGKNDTGAPTKYNPEFCQEIVNYFLNSPKTERIIKSKTSGNGKNGEWEKIEYETIACELPTISKYAIKINVNLDTIYEWEKVHEEFSESLKFCRMIYKDFLNDNGLSGWYNPLYAKFVATNTTDMTDKQEVDMGKKTFEFFQSQIDKYQK